MASKKKQEVDPAAEVIRLRFVNRRGKPSNPTNRPDLVSKNGYRCKQLGKRVELEDGSTIPEGCISYITVCTDCSLYHKP